MRKLSGQQSWHKACAEQMSRRPDFKICDLDGARRHMSNITEGRCEFSAKEPKRFNAFGTTHFTLGQTSIHYLRWDSESEFETSTYFPDGYHVLIHFPLMNEFETFAGGRSVRTRTGEALVVSEPGIAVKRWRGSGEMLSLVVPRKVLAVSLDQPSRGLSAVDFKSLSVVDMHGMSTLAHYLETIIRDLSGPTPVFLDSQLAAQAERTLLMMLLGTIPRSNQPAPSKIAPYYVRRAECFMRKNLGCSFTFDALLKASGVSARTIYYGFKQYRSSSPMKYLKKARLTAARCELQEKRRVFPLPLAQLMQRYGYLNASQFSRDYRKEFDESPRQTINSACPANCRV
jgi:AraC-like DNA-binding protein